MGILSSYYQCIIHWSEKFVTSKNWLWKASFLGVLVVFLSFFNNFSPLYTFKDFYEATVVKGGEYHIYQTIKDRSENLFGNFDYEPNIGLESRVFRFTLPVMTRILGIKHVSLVLYALQFILGPFFFFLLLKFLQNLLEDKVAALWAFFSICGLYVGASFFIDNATYGDFFSFFFLFLTIYFWDKPVYGLFFAAMAMWNDERAFVATGLLMAWYWWFPAFSTGKTLKLFPSWPMVLLFLGWIGFFMVRWYLENEVGMQVTYLPDNEYATKIPQSLQSLGFRVLWPFEGWWLLFILAAILLWKAKAYFSMVLIYIPALVSIFSATMVYDSTRSASFGFLLIFFVLAILKQYLTEKELRAALILVALLCFLHPLATKTHGIGFFLM